MKQYNLLIGKKDAFEPSKFIVTEVDKSFSIAWDVNGTWYSFEYPRDEVVPSKEELIWALKLHFDVVEEVEC